MSRRVDLYSGTYTRFSDDVLSRVRRETYGTDLGQSGWTVESEYRRFLRELHLAPGTRLLDLACGSGGLALFSVRTTGCEVVGMDSNRHAVRAGRFMADQAGLADRAKFQLVEEDGTVPAESGSFDAILCIDALIHFPHRLRLFRDWRRLLRTKGRVLFTDPAVVTGLVTDEELAIRSSIGRFVFSPPHYNARLLEESGLRLLRFEDSTRRLEQVAGNWHDARSHHEPQLVRLEGRRRFEGLQRFLDCVHALARERRLSRHTFLAERP